MPISDAHLIRKVLNCQVVQLLGTATSPVFLCAREPKRDLVVVKTASLRKPSAQCRDAMSRESAVASRLLAAGAPHPHVVRFLEVKHGRSSAGKPVSSFADAVLVMEYCPNGDLFARLEQQPGNCFAEADALCIFRQIVAGVHHLHSLGFAHRDISLENVLLDAHGNAKLCDFGLSTSLAETSCQLVGKPHYIAPEVAVGMGACGVTADVWSLGIVLFIMLTGSPLFTMAVASDPVWAVMERVGVTGILRLWGMHAQLSATTTDLLERMLRLDAAQRPQSLATILAALP